MFWRYTGFAIYYSGFCYQKVTLKWFSDFFLFLVSHCRSYVNVTDLSRFWDAKERSASEIEDSCQDQHFPFWTRFIYDNITNAMIPHNCTPSNANLTNPLVVHYIVVGFKESTLPLKTVNIRHFIFVFYLVRILLKSLRKIIIILGGFKLEEEYKVIKSILQEHFIFYLLCIVLLTANSTFELTKQFYQNFFHLIYIINLESPNQKI